jgi:hypothetical protein
MFPGGNNLQSHMPLMPLASCHRLLLLLLLLPWLLHCTAAFGPVAHSRQHSCGSTPL